MAYIDFAKVFDSVNHGFLLAKLESFGLCEKVVRWIRSYLTGRTYKVQVADALSQETKIKSGVPQGSVIGPLLFLLLVNDFPSFMNMTTLFSPTTSNGPDTITKRPFVGLPLQYLE